MTSIKSKSHNMASLLFLMMATTFCTLTQAKAQDSPNDTLSSVLSTADGISWGPAIIAVIAIVAGAVICGAGYRLFRFTIFAAGFIVGGLLVSSILEACFKSKSWIATGSWIGFLVGGIIVGMMAMAFYTTSIFIAGGAAGVLLAFTLHTTATYKISESHPNTVLVVSAIILGLLGGFLALKLEKPVLVIATSFMGAIMTVWGIGYFAGDFPNAADLKHYETRNVDGGMMIDIPSAWWGYLAGIIALFVFGMMIQFRKTGRNGDYHSTGRKHERKPAEPYNDVQTPPHGTGRYGQPVSHV